MIAKLNNTGGVQIITDVKPDDSDIRFQYSIEPSTHIDMLNQPIEKDCNKRRYNFGAIGSARDYSGVLTAQNEIRIHGKMESPD